MPCICAIAGAIPPDYVDASYSSKTEKKASVDAEGNFDPKPVETTKWDPWMGESEMKEMKERENDEGPKRGRDEGVRWRREEGEMKGE